MQRIRAELPRLTPLTAAVIGLYIGVNLLLAKYVTLSPPDWDLLWSDIPDLVASGDLYGPRPMVFAWSPVAAWLLVPVAWLGFFPYAAAHVLTVLLLRRAELILLMFLSWGFWIDVLAASTMTFVVVAGILALRGSRIAALVYLAFCVLMPRPLQIPLAVWLLAHDRGLWRPFAGLFAVHAALVIFSGQAVEWIGAMVRYSGSPVSDMGPTAIFGASWLVIGLPLAAFLTWRGWFGLAGLAMSPYLHGQYLLMPFIDLETRRATKEPPPEGS